MRGIGLFAIIGFNAFRAICNTNPAPSKGGDAASTLTIGGLCMLAGVALSTLHWVYKTRANRTV